MNDEDRNLIWLLVMTLTGVYILLLPMPLTLIAMGLSVACAVKAIKR